MARGVILLKPEHIFHREAGKESERVKGGGEEGLKAQCNLTELQNSDILTHLSSAFSTKVASHCIRAVGLRVPIVSDLMGLWAQPGRLRQWGVCTTGLPAG